MSEQYFPSSTMSCAFIEPGLSKLSPNSSHALNFKGLGL
ncbi:hypothetical protein CP02DC21_1734, partial [Chlamydia psittaci 02DC21]